MNLETGKRTARKAWRAALAVWLILATSVAADPLRIVFWDGVNFLTAANSSTQVVFDVGAHSLEGVITGGQANVTLGTNMMVGRIRSDAVVVAGTLTTVIDGIYTNAGTNFSYAGSNHYIRVGSSSNVLWYVGPNEAGPGWALGPGAPTYHWYCSTLLGTYSFQTGPEYGNPTVTEYTGPTIPGCPGRVIFQHVATTNDLAGMLTNAVGSGAATVTVSNNTIWINVDASGGGGGASEADTNYFRNWPNMTNLPASFVGTADTNYFRNWPNMTNTASVITNGGTGMLSRAAIPILNGVTSLTAFGSTRTTWPGTNGVCFRAQTSTNLPVASGAYRVLLFDTEVFDIGNGWNAASRRYQPTVAGYYLFTQGLYLSWSPASAAITAIAMFTNGVLKDVASYVHNDATATDVILSSSVIMHLNGSTEYVQPGTYSSINNTIISGYTYFSGTLVAADNP